LNKVINFQYIEDVLKFPTMKDVLAEFRESDIIIRACQKQNFTALKWLINMEINPFIADKNGMTSLMHAAKEQSLFFVVEYLVKYNEDLINIKDNNGKNVLFHATDNSVAYNYLLKFNISNEEKTTFDLVLEKLYDNKKSLDVIKILDNIDFNVTDQEGNTILMHILKNEKYDLCIDILKELRKEAKTSSKLAEFNINYRNKLNNESIFSIFIKKYYQMCCEKNYRQVVSEKRDLLTSLAIIFSLIISYPGFNINMTIDDEGNTPIMFFLMINDIVVINYILSYCDDVDLGIKNKHGISASVLSLKVQEEITILQQLINHKTFDKEFVDQYNNNILIYSILFNNTYAYTTILNENPKFIEKLNNKKEDSIIVATKLGFLDKIKNYTIRNANFNQQDELGNNALFYAVKTKNPYDINLLAYNNADPNLKNNQGMSPMDLAKQINEEKLIKYMNKPRPPHKMKEKLEKSKKGFWGKKSSDEKIEEYIKNYQIKNFTEEYKEILDTCNHYVPIEDRIHKVDEQLALVIYVMLNRCKSYTTNKAFPKEVFERRIEQYIESRYDYESDIIIAQILTSSKPLEEIIDMDKIFRYGEPTILLQSEVLS